MNNNSTMLQLCRLCLVKDNVNIPIFEGQGDISQIFQKISSCLPVKVTREDKLPQKICDGCSYKLDIVNDFRNTTVNAEKQLLTWLSDATSGSAAAAVAVTRQVETDVAQQIKPAETFVKQEAIDPSDVSKEEDDVKSYMFQDKFELPAESKTSENEDEPPPKRAKRTAAVKAAIALDNDSDEDDDDSGEPLTKVEDESDEGSDEDHSFVDIPSTSADDQPGPSGVNKDGGEAPSLCHSTDFPTDLSFDTFNINLPIQDMQTKYFVDIENPQKTSLESVSSLVDHLNESDADLLNLLTNEDDCSAILDKLATNVHFQGFMNASAAFPEREDIEKFINETYQAAGLTATANECDEQSKEIFKCDNCGKTFAAKRLLKKHLLIHTRERKFPCSYCGKLFRQRYEVTSHEKSHQNPTFQCDICSAMFIHKSHLNTHRKKHLGEYLAYCDKCEMGFLSQAAFRSHKNVFHENTKLICDHCGAELSTHSALKEHKLTHDPKYGKERTHVCDVCGKSYLTSRNLKTHLKIHAQYKPHICNICGKSVSSKTILETHVKLHTGLKDFNCEICDKNFASKEYLRIHQRIHTGDKPFQCTYCGKKFTQKTSLTVHIRCHTGQKPYKCECGKEFTTKSHLMTHYKTHDIGGVDIEYISHPHW